MSQPIPSGVPPHLYARLSAYVRDRLSGDHGYSDLALHQVSAHCNGAALCHTPAESEDAHHHEHYGPGGIRNHDYDDHSWDTEEVIHVIIDSAEMDLSTAREEHLDLHKWQDAIDDLMNPADTAGTSEVRAEATDGGAGDGSSPATRHPSAQAFLDDLLPAPFAQTLAMVVDADEPPVTLCNMDDMTDGAAKSALVALRQCLLLIDKAHTPAPVFEFVAWGSIAEVSARNGMLRIATTHEPTKVVTITDTDDGGLAALTFAAHVASYLPTPQPAPRYASQPARESAS